MENTLPTPSVQLEYPQDGCALLTLNRPHAKNALSTDLRRELVRLFETELPGRARVIVLTGAGGVFCAGLDLKELAGSTDVRALITDPAADVVGAMRAFAGPIIGAVDGAAITGGFEVALACDLLLASETARFADTHVRVGVLPAWGLSQILQRRIGAGRAKQMSLTGNFIGARQALAWGLVNDVCPQPDLLPAALRLAADMLSAPPDMLRAYKSLIDRGGLLDLQAALTLEQKASAEWAARLSVADLEQRRKEVLQRGRSQAEGA